MKHLIVLAALAMVSSVGMAKSKTLNGDCVADGVHYNRLNFFNSAASMSRNGSCVHARIQYINENGGLEGARRSGRVYIGGEKKADGISVSEVRSQFPGCNELACVEIGYDSTGTSNEAPRTETPVIFIPSGGGGW